MRTVLSILTTAGAVAATTAAILIFLTMRKMCLIAAGGHLPDLLVTLTTACTVLSSITLLTVTAASNRFPVSVYKAVLWTTALLAVASSAAAGWETARILSGPPATRRATSWGEVARCLAGTDDCKASSSTAYWREACCKKPAECAPARKSLDCQLWRPDADKLCFSCFRCRSSTRRAARSAATVPIAVLLAGVCLLLLATFGHAYADWKGKIPLPPRPTTTTAVTTTTTVTSTTAADN